MLAATALNDRFAGGLGIRSVPQLEVIRTVAVPAGTVARFAPDGRSLLYGDREGCLWTLDTRTWKPTGHTLGDGGWIRNAGISPDGRMLVTTAPAVCGTSHPADRSAPRCQARPETRSRRASSGAAPISWSSTSWRVSPGTSVPPRGRATPARSPAAR
jgi:hypothetical protein